MNIIILNYSGPSVDVHQYDEKEFPEAEDFVTSLGHSLYNVEYMTSEDEFEINHHS